MWLRVKLHKVIKCFCFEPQFEIREGIHKNKNTKYPSLHPLWAMRTWRSLQTRTSWAATFSLCSSHWCHWTGYLAFSFAFRVVNEAAEGKLSSVTGGAWEVSNSKSSELWIQRKHYCPCLFKGDWGILWWNKFRISSNKSARHQEEAKEDTKLWKRLTLICWPERRPSLQVSQSGDTPSKTNSIVRVMNW